VRPYTPPGFKPRPQRGQVVRVPIPDEKTKRPAVVIRVDEATKRVLIVYFTSSWRDNRGKRIEITHGTRDFQELGLDNTSYAYGGSNKILPTVRSAAFDYLSILPNRCPRELLIELTKFADEVSKGMTPEQLREDLPDSLAPASPAPSSPSPKAGPPGGRVPG